MMVVFGWVGLKKFHCVCGIIIIGVARVLAPSSHEGFADAQPSIPTKKPFAKHSVKTTRIKFPLKITLGASYGPIIGLKFFLLPLALGLLEV